MNKDNMIEALRKSIDKCGIEILSSKSRLKAILNDFLPGTNNKFERKFLLDALEIDEWHILLETHYKGQSEHIRAVNVLLPLLKDYLGWTQERCVLLLECYITAMGWNDVTVMKSPSKDQSSPQSSIQPNLQPNTKSQEGTNADVQNDDPLVLQNYMKDTSLSENKNDAETTTKIMVVGVGGAGNNIVNTMIDEKINGVNFVAIATDKMVLTLCKAPKHLLIGKQCTKGLGTGRNPEIGKKAAEESSEEISEILKGFEMIFVIGGMGGGTGTGAVPVVARIAKDMGILTIVMVTKPFRFEEKNKMIIALNGIEKIRKHVDTLIVISNDIIIEIVDRNTTLPSALKKVTYVLLQAIQGINDLINTPAIINLDFVDVQTFMKDKGVAHIGIGSGKGRDKAIEAVKKAVSNPFMETTICGASHVLILVSGEISLKDYYNAVSYIHEQAGSSAIIAGGFVYKKTDSDTCNITVIAAGLDEKNNLESK